MGDAVETGIFGGVLFSQFGEWENLSRDDFTGAYEDLDPGVACTRFWDSDQVWRPLNEEEGDMLEKRSLEEALALSAKSVKTRSYRRSGGQANAACGGNPALIKKRREAGPSQHTGIGTYGSYGAFIL